MADAPHDLAPPWLDTLFDAIYGAYNTRDAAATARCYTPDVAITINGEPGPADREAFIEGLHEQWRGFPDVTVTETNRIVIGNTVVTEMLVDGHNSAPFLERPPTGKRWRSQLAWVCTVQDGQVAALRVYIDNRALLDAVRA